MKRVAMTLFMAATIFPLIGAPRNASAVNSYEQRPQAICAVESVSMTYDPATPANARVSLKCAENPVETYAIPNPAIVTEFAVPWSDTKRADRVLALATTALISGRALKVVWLRNDNSGAAFGCVSSGAELCRPILTLSLE